MLFPVFVFEVEPQKGTETLTIDIGFTGMDGQERPVKFVYV